MNPKSPQQYVHPYRVALIHLALGDRERALDWLDRARDERCWIVIYLKVEPRLDVRRGNPRFEQLLAQVRYSN